MRISTLAVSVTLLMGWVTSCHHYGSEHYKALAWKTNDVALTGRAKKLAPVVYPEVAYGYVKGKADLGIAFSGGGNRSATMTSGQLRALNQLGLLKRAKYISAVSGGTWCAVPYTFLTDASPDRDASFLGPIREPEELGWATLKAAPPAGSFARCAANARVGSRALLQGRGGEGFAHVLARIYLREFHLDNEHTFVAHDAQQRDRLIHNNAAEGLKESDFHLAAPGRPYLIANATLMHRGETFEHRFRPLEFTSLYTGMRSHVGPEEFEVTKPATYFPTGGGYVETFAYDSVLKKASAQGGNAWAVDVDLPSPFWLHSPRLSLADVLATSGAAPSAFLPMLSSLLGLPTLNHWPVGELPKAVSHKFKHADGGALDNTGIAALVARGVRNIIAFDNMANISDQDESFKMSPWTPGLFGEKGDGIMGLALSYQSKTSQIFKGGADYERLVRRIQDAWSKGGPLIIESDHITVDNALFSVRGGRHVHVLWVLPGPSAGWLKKHGSPSTTQLPKGSFLRWFTRLPADTRKHVAPVDPGKRPDRSFRDFPCLSVVFENGSDVLYLKNEQVNALADYTSFSVMENRAVFEKMLR